MKLWDKILFTASMGSCLILFVLGCVVFKDFPGLGTFLIPSSLFMGWGSIHMLASDAQKAKTPAAPNQQVLVVVEPKRQEIA